MGDEQCGLILVVARQKSSGVSVNDQCLELFQEFKLRKKYKYIVFKVSGMVEGKKKRDRVE